MDLKALLGLAFIVLIIGRGYFQIRADRKLGATQNFGHPILDSVLLLTSALILASAFGIGLWLLDLHGIALHGPADSLGPVVLLVLAGGLCWACSAILRRSRKR